MIVYNFSGKESRSGLRSHLKPEAKRSIDFEVYGSAGVWLCVCLDFYERELFGSRSFYSLITFLEVLSH